ncbi:MAG: pro-sigmaK processing inhibitor BofA family protein [Clostridia bacterium]|nr:pro-sigmaK processing inhibitor BofA family protein [Clostridia bacterium]
MKTLAIVLISVISVFALIILALHMKSRRPFRSAGINALIGIAAFAAVNLTTRFTGVRIPVNVYTLPGAAIFGLPACALFVLLETVI